jgi:predicted nucleotidyltransferase
LKLERIREKNRGRSGFMGLKELRALGGLWTDLHQLLGVKVDLVTANGLRERILERVLKEAVPL